MTSREETPSERGRREIRLTEEALERPADQREAFVRDRCGNDAERAAGVLELLSRYSRTDTGYAGPLEDVTLGPKLPAAPGDEPSSWRGFLGQLESRGKPHSRYRLQGEVARGGMGVVLRVFDEDIRRPLAMKVILGSAPRSGDTPAVDDQTLGRFLEHEDTDDDGDVDASDKWFYLMYDERWRWVATFREDDSDPKEEFVPHQAGLDGQGGSSYIDLVVLRDRDGGNGDWTTAADGTLEERLYYCQNWRADVSAIVEDTGEMVEWVKYSAYGVPFGMPRGDTDSDGDADSTDRSNINGWSSGYDVRYDVDLDGDIDAADESAASDVTLGRGGLSQVMVRRAYAGYVYLNRGTYVARSRCYVPAVGGWASRDKLMYRDSSTLYGYARSNPSLRVDPTGHLSLPSGGGDWGPPYSTQKNAHDWLIFWRLTAPNCCAQVEEQTEANGGVGTVMCCEGKMITCSFLDPSDYQSIPNAAPDSVNGPMPASLGASFNDCIGEHEETHFDDVPPCAPGQTGPLFFTPDTDVDAEEVVGYIEELACILGIDCDGDALCEAWVLAMAQDRCGQISSRGGDCDVNEIKYPPEDGDP